MYKRQGFIEAVLADGGVDILVNNVGASPSRNFQYMTDEDWHDLHELNLMSAVRCTRAFLPGMRASGWGRVVMIATGAAFYPGAALIDYAATKAAMVATGKALAGKYGRDGVLVNSVLPGWTITELASGGYENDRFREVTTRRTPARRWADPSEFREVGAFLADPNQTFHTGQEVTVDGGYTVF